MSPSPTPDDDPQTLDARVEANIRLLESRRIALQAQLLSLRAQRSILSTIPAPTPTASFASTIPDTPPDNNPTPEDSSTSDDALLHNALTTASVLRTHNLTNLYRMTGITSFAVKEPVTNTPLLGIRYDAYDRRTRGFVKPLYTLLKHTPDGWIVQRHTAPAHIGVSRLSNIYLPIAKGAGKQKVEEFAKAVHRRIVRWRRRESAAKWMKEKAVEAKAAAADVDGGRVVDEVGCDEEVKSLEIKFRDGTKVLAKVDEMGKIESAVALDKKGGRDLRLQRAVRGSLDELPHRLGWV